jgi:hypothetical protein
MKVIAARKIPVLLTLFVGAVLACLPACNNVASNEAKEQQPNG